MRPRIRTIKPEFFEDERINALSVGTRFVAVGLISAADDRGRIWRLPALRTHVFPHGDITERQFDKAVNEIAATGFVWQYEVGDKTYLWLPNFWKHQRINRPSESALPPHPDDPDGGLPVSEAVAQFTERSRSGHGRLTESSLSSHSSRVGARSVPFLLCERLEEHIRRNDARANPKITARWLTDMRLLVEDRDGDVAQVERVVDWCQADSFWRSNILSPGKLRTQFTQLLLRAERPKANVTPMRKENASDMLATLRQRREQQDIVEGGAA